MSETPNKPASFFARFTAFGWLCALGGGAFLYIERATPTLPVLGLGFALVLLGGVCIDRTPVTAFIAGITGAITAWRGHHDP